MCAKLRYRGLKLSINTQSHRVLTAFNLLRWTQDLESKLHEMDFPFLVIHGSHDTVTDPTVSQTLYEKAGSKDKEFVLLEGRSVERKEERQRERETCLKDMSLMHAPGIIM